MKGGLKEADKKWRAVRKKYPPYKKKKSPARNKIKKGEGVKYFL